jgi:hypothetical protein
MNYPNDLNCFPLLQESILASLEFGLSGDSVLSLPEYYLYSLSLQLRLTEFIRFHLLKIIKKITSTGFLCENAHK